MSAATYYDILRVSRGAAPEGVRRAYRSLAQRYHPDKLQGSDDAARVMAALNEAYAVLSDPDKRALYDRAIAGAQARASARRASRPLVREAAWPWWLLFGTIAFAMAVIGTVAYRMIFPLVAVAAVHATAQQQAPAVSARLPRK
jgi:curved DNA-binding protein CbpA